MNRFWMGIAAVAASLILPCMGRAQAKVDDGFAQAVTEAETKNTGLRYFLLTIVYDPTKETHKVAHLASTLTSAIHAEYTLDSSDVNQRKVIAIILRNKTRTYQFKQQFGFDTLRPGYSPKILSEVMAQLKPFSKIELARKLEAGELDPIYLKYQGPLAQKLGQKPDYTRYVMCRDAFVTACFLRGLPVRSTGQVAVSGVVRAEIWPARPPSP